MLLNICHITTQKKHAQWLQPHCSIIDIRSISSTEELEAGKFSNFTPIYLTQLTLASNRCNNLYKENIICHSGRGEIHLLFHRIVPHKIYGYFLRKNGFYCQLDQRSLLTWSLSRTLRNRCEVRCTQEMLDHL